jgi:nitrite reductase/ring-hydroxylating ferredoxin subunit/uncharacterized membrane protein
MNPEMTSTQRPIDALGRSTALDGLADAVQPALRKWLEGTDGAQRPIKDLLHGTWLGHPLHPLITDIPIGAWTVTAVCDALDLLGVKRFRDAADIALVIGEVGAWGAAITGLADWSDTKDEPKRVGALHAILNATGSTCYTASFIARRVKARRLGIALAFAGYGIITAAAYLGGELSMGMNLGAKHTAIPIEPSNHFVRVADDASLGDDKMLAGDAKGVPVILARRNGKPKAVSGVCTHRGAPLADGTYADGCVTCPWHASRFSVDDGRVLEGPATFPLASFETRVADGGISVRPIT